MAKTEGSARSPKAPNIDVPGYSVLQQRIEVLCPELWLEIFSYTIDGNSDLYDCIPWTSVTGESASRLDNPKGTLSASRKSIDPSEPLRIISHVCRYWRAIMSDAPLLWSQVIDCGFLEPLWLKTVLDYAKDAPLNVRYSPQSRYGQEKEITEHEMDTNLFLVLISKNEFKEFHADFMDVQPSKHTTAAFLERFQRPMPQLTALSLHPRSQGLAMKLFNSSPLNLFQGTVPLNLKRATFPQGIFSNYPTSPWQNVTFLSISNISLFEFLPLSILEQTPLLEHLVAVIDNFRNLREEAFFPARKRVKHPCLSRIQFSGPFKVFILLLGSLEPPLALTSLVCRITDCDFSPTTAKEFSTVLHGISSSPDQEITQSANTTCLDISGRVPRIHVTTNNASNKYHFSHDFEFKDSTDADDSLLLMEKFRPFFNTCTRLIVEAKQLDLDLPEDHNSDLLLELLPWFVNVQTMAFHETTYSLVYPLLADISLPHLQEMVMPFAVSRESGYLDEISDFLTERQKSGRPITTLSFPIENGRHKSVKCNRRAKMLNKLFGVNVKFGEEDPPWSDLANLKDDLS